MGGILADLKFALRTLRRSPLFTLIAVLTLALGIGANTAMFRIVDAVLLRSLPVRQPEELMVVRGVVPYARFAQFRDRNQVFSGLVGTYTLRDAQVDTDGRTLGRVGVELVSGDYFSVIGVDTVVGRPLTADDDRAPFSSPVAVISYGFWRRAMAAAPDVIGRRLVVRGGEVGNVGVSGFEVPAAAERHDGTLLTIVGVAPREFFGDTVGTAVDVWTPMMMQPSLMPGRAWLQRTTAQWVNMMGRRRPGISEEQVRSSLTVLNRQIRSDEIGSAITDRQRQSIARLTLIVESGERGFAQLQREFSQPLLILIAVVALVLMIACLNVANLQLARATARRHEIAMRLSLGAGRPRLVRQLLTESLVLAALGGALGLALAAVGTNVLVGMVSNESRPIALGFDMSWRIFAFTVAITVASAIVFGLLPALGGTRSGLVTGLRESSRTTAAGGTRAAKTLIVSQVAVSLVLLVGAGLFLRTLYNLKTQHVGYDPNDLVLMHLDPIGAGYRGDDIGRACIELMHRFAVIPGVRAVTFSENGLFSGTDSASNIDVEGYKADKDDDRLARFDQIGPNYFTHVGIPLLLGRDIAERDRAGAPRVAVINETMASFYFPNASPIGRHIVDRIGPTDVSIEIIGVARDAQDHSFRQPPVRRFYVSYLQPVDGITGVNFEIRQQPNVPLSFAALRAEVQAFNPTLAIASLKTVTTRMDDSITTERLVAQLSGFFGALAVLLAAIGLYGVMSYTVARRTNEIGIRMALGAPRANVARLVVGEIVLLVAAGAIAGALASFGLTRYVSSLIFGLTPNDPLTFVAAAIVLLAVGLLAGYLPARRAARIDPLIALRYE
jgi:predicted permease